MPGEQIIYYGVFVTPLNTPIFRIDADDDGELLGIRDDNDFPVTKDDIDSLVTEDDMNAAIKVIDLKLQGRDREIFFTSASLRVTATGLNRILPFSNEENLVGFKTLYTAILDGRVTSRCSSSLLNISISTNSKEEKFNLLMELKNADIEILGAILFNRKSRFPISMKHSRINFITLGIYETISIKKKSKNIMFTCDWQVFGRPKVKYEEVAIIMKKCVQNFAQYAWKMDLKRVRNIHCFYVDISNGLDLNQWSNEKPQTKDFPNGWIVNGTIAHPPYVCFVLFCPMNACVQAKSLVSELLVKFTIPDKEPLPTELDLSCEVDFNLTTMGLNQLQGIKKLILAECKIDIWSKETLIRAIVSVEMLVNLEFLDLSYNYLSGNGGYKFIEDIFRIRNDLQVSIKGTMLAEQNYSFSGNIILF
jgi:hypothetical protein